MVHYSSIARQINYLPFIAPMLHSSIASTVLVLSCLLWRLSPSATRLGQGLQGRHQCVWATSGVCLGALIHVSTQQPRTQCSTWTMPGLSAKLHIHSVWYSSWSFQALKLKSWMHIKHALHLLNLKFGERKRKGIEVLKKPQIYTR